MVEAVTILTCEEYDVLGCNAVQIGKAFVSEEHIASIFRVEKYAKGDTRTNNQQLQHGGPYPS
jgi:hypothetical protein